MCVEVDITKPLLARFILRGKVGQIEYEGLHLVCYKCGIYGHCMDKFPLKKTDAVGEEVSLILVRKCGHKQIAEGNVENENPTGNE